MDLDVDASIRLDLVACDYACSASRCIKAAFVCLHRIKCFTGFLSGSPCGAIRLARPHTRGIIHCEAGRISH